jgi:hypothetical protein
MLRIVTYFGELRSREGGCADDEFLESATLAPADIRAQPSFGMVVSWPISGVGEVMKQQALSPLVARTADSLTASFELDGAEYSASLSTTQGFGPAADCLLALGLLPAMTAGHRLRLPDAVSPRLLSAVPEIQNIYRAWDRDRFERVAVEAKVREAKPGTPAPGVGCFFSGGVDSFYTLLKHRKRSRT